MTTHRQPSKDAPAQCRIREARGVSAAEMLAILAPTPDEPESLRSLYLWKTGDPAPSVQPSAA